MAANPRPIAAARRFLGGLREVGEWLSRPSNRWELNWFEQAELNSPDRGSGRRLRSGASQLFITMCDGVDYKHSLS